jgi:hypothetical protein
MNVYMSKNPTFLQGKYEIMWRIQVAIEQPFKTTYFFQSYIYSLLPSVINKLDRK